MILWFLSLFTAFRELDNCAARMAEEIERSDSAYKTLHDEKCALEDRVHTLLTEVEAERQDLKNLQGANQELITEKLLLQDRLESALSDKDKLWDTMTEAMNGERPALHTMVNHSVQKNGGGIPFPDAHALPPSEVRKVQESGPVGRRSRILPSELAERQSVKFIKDYVESMGPATTEKVG